jgi:uncharacterized BrkB/YihY/UPF0761 family membrane protein
MIVITTLLNTALSFVRDNLFEIIVVLGIAAFILFAFKITISSLKKLKFEVLPYYPFDRYSPQSQKWSLLYFFIVTFFLAALIFLLTKGNFNFGPA